MLKGKPVGVQLPSKEDDTAIEKYDQRHFVQPRPSVLKPFQVLIGKLQFGDGIYLPDQGLEKEEVEDIEDQKAG